MQVLTKETFDAAVQKCKETSGYKVLIVTDSFKDRDFIIDNWVSEHRKDFLIVNRSLSIIKFENGSLIKMAGLESQMRGQRADLVLCNAWMMNDDDIRPVLQVIEMYNRNFNLGRGKRAEAGIYDDAMCADINGLLIPDNIVNGILDDVYPINIDINNLPKPKTNIEDIVAEIEKILKGD